MSYSRRSSDKGDESYAHPMQHRVTRAYADTHGHTIVSERSETMTGTRLDRPVWEEVLQMLRDRVADGVVVYRDVGSSRLPPRTR